MLVTMAANDIAEIQSRLIDGDDSTFWSGGYLPTQEELDDAKLTITDKSGSYDCMCIKTDNGVVAMGSLFDAEIIVPYRFKPSGDNHGC